MIAERYGEAIAKQKQRQEQSRFLVAVGIRVVNRYFYFYISLFSFCLFIRYFFAEELARAPLRSPWQRFLCIPGRPYTLLQHIGMCSYGRVPAPRIFTKLIKQNTLTQDATRLSAFPCAVVSVFAPCF